MSHTSVTYPQTHIRDLTPVHPWQIRENDDDYDTNNDGSINRDTQLALTDHITERLTRAEALAWMLQSSEHAPEHTTGITSMLILELIQEAREANEKVWEQARQLTRKDN